MENGMEFDSTKVYVELPFDESKGNAKGMSVQEYNLGDSTQFLKYKHNTFPFTAIADMEVVTTGKTQKMQMVDLRPVEVAKSEKKAA